MRGMVCGRGVKLIRRDGVLVAVRDRLTPQGCRPEEIYKVKITVLCSMGLADSVCAAIYQADQFADTFQHPGAFKQTEGGSMGSVKVYRVVVEQQRNGGWKWTPTDAQGKVKLAGGRSDYGRKHDAVRGARRACGAKIRIAFA